MIRSLLLVFVLFAAIGSARAQSLEIADRGTTKTYTVAQLLANKAMRTLQIVDPVYKRPMSYRVLAMADLLSDLKIGNDDYVQARAVDNFSVAIPAALLKVDAFLAIESPTVPWPITPMRT